MSYILLKQGLNRTVTLAEVTVYQAQAQALDRAARIATNDRTNVLVAKLESIVSTSIVTEVTPYGTDRTGTDSSAQSADQSDNHPHDSKDQG